MQYLILGATSYIGGYLYKRMKQSGVDVLGTSRSPEHSTEFLKYDIETDDIDSIIDQMPNKRKIAIICIAVSNINQCNEKYAQSYNINVVKTIEIIQKLAAKGVHVIWFSSDNVFDGKKGNYTEIDATCPVNCYGSMKEEVEKYILNNYPSACIFRISKVVHYERQKQNVLTEWEMQYERGETIRCIRENKLSFVGIEDIYRSCIIAGSNELAGLYNVVGNQSFTRKELAEIFFKMQDITPPMIEEADIEDFHFKDKRPLNISMSNHRFCSNTGYRFMPVEQVITRYIIETQRD